MSPKELQDNFDKFYEDFYIELCKFGNLQEMHVCDNVGDHLMGNVYARYEWEAEAAKAVQALNDRWYAMRPLHCELSPVSDFRESCCRQNELGECKREGFCNFMHLCHPTKSLVTSLEASQRMSRRQKSANGAADAVKDMGWVPGAARAADGPGGWVPPVGGGDGGLGWTPGRR